MYATNNHSPKLSFASIPPTSHPVVSQHELDSNKFPQHAITTLLKRSGYTGDAPLTYQLDRRHTPGGRHP